MKQYCMVQYTPQIIIILKQVLVKKSAYYTQVNTVMFLISLYSSWSKEACCSGKQSWNSTIIDN